MSNKVWDKISYAQSEAVSHTENQIELICSSEAERKRALEWWLNSVQQFKKKNDHDEYRVSLWYPEFGEDDA
jgi:hypothetical protein